MIEAGYLKNEAENGGEMAKKGSKMSEKRIDMFENGRNMSEKTFFVTDVTDVTDLFSMGVFLEGLKI